MPASPTKLTQQLLEAAGWTVRRVDHRHPFANKWVDFLGVADLLAMAPDKGLMLVQLTADSDRRTGSGNLSKRRAKILASDDARMWLESGGRLCLIGWVRSPKGAAEGLVARVEELSLADFEKGGA
jgi:hypothetical protein